MHVIGQGSHQSAYPMAKKSRPENLEQLNPAEIEPDPDEWLEAFVPKPSADKPKPLEEMPPKDPNA